MPPRELGPHATIVDDETFLLVTELEIRKALRLQYPVSVVAIRPDPEGGGEMADPHHLAEQLAQAVSPVLRGTDLIRLGAASPSLHVLLVGAALEHLDPITERLREEVGRHQFQINGRRKAVTLHLGHACFPTTASTSQDLVTQADTRVRGARRD